MKHFLALGLLLLAFWLRLESLDTLPPGLSNDEAVNAVDAFHLSRTGNFPLYEDPNRPEPLFRVAQAAGILFFGPSVWAFRLVSVFTGLLTVAAAVWAMRECLHDLDPRLRRIAGFTAGAALAVSLSHITLSRALYRAIPQPLFMFLFAGLLLRGLRTQRRQDFVLSGISLAAVLYTYTAALALPAAVGVVGLSLLMFQRASWRTWLPNLIILGAVVAVLMIPVGLRFLDNPESVIGRAAVVSEREGPDLGERLGRLAGQFFVAGDINPQYNVKSAPLLPPIFNVFFVVGLLALLIWARQPSSALVVALLILSALPVLATEEIPHGLRVIGEFAVFPLLVGLGVAFTFLLSAYLRRMNARLLLFAAVNGALILATVGNGFEARHTYAAYWEQPHIWRVHGVELQHGEWFFRTDRRDFARWLSAQEEPLLVPLDELNAPTTRTWLMTAYPDVVTADDDFDTPADTRLVAPWSLELGDLRRETRHYGLLNEGAITILPPLSTETRETLLAGIDEAEAVERANGDLLARIVTLPDDQDVAFEPRTVTSPLSLATFGEEMRLLGWRGPDTLSNENRTLIYTLDWQPLRSHLGHEYSAFLQLQTQDYERIAGDDVRIWRWLFPSTIWHADDVIYDTHILQLPVDLELEPGAYRLVAGVYPFMGDRLPVSGGLPGSLDDVAMLGWVKVPQPDQLSLDENALRVNATLDDTFALRGSHTLRLEDARIRISLYWQSLVMRPDIDATIFVHVLDEDGAIVDQDDRRPWNGQYPTFIWDEGEIVRTDHVLDLPDTASIDLNVTAGMYVFPGPENLAVEQNGEVNPDRRIVLGLLTDLLEE